MTGARWRKVRADLLANRLRSGLAILSLAVGTTAVGAMFFAATTVDASFTSSFLGADPPSAVLVTDGFEPELVEEVAGHPTVAQAAGRRLHRARIAGPGGEPVSVELVALPDFAGNSVARIDPLAGTWPPAPGGIVLERASVAEFGADVGDVVAVEVPGESPLELSVSGTAFDVSEVAPMLGGSVRGYVAMDTMVALTGSDHLDALYLRAAEGAGSGELASAMTAAVRDDVLAPAGVTVASNAVDEPGVHPGSSALSFLTLAMQLLSLLALAIAVGLVVNTVAALLAQQRRQVGVMKAIGATSRHLTVQYLAYVALLSTVAIALSVPASLLLGQLVAGVVADLANIDLAPTGVPFAAVGLQVAIALLVPMAAVILAVRRTSRTTVRDAITDRGLAGHGRVRRVISPFARPTVLAYRNAVRNRARLGLTVLTVALCGAVLVGVSSTGSALGLLSDEVAGYADYDVALSFTESVALDEAVDVLDDEPAVRSAEGWQQAQGARILPDGTERGGIDITGVPTGSMSVEPTLLQGRWFIAGDDRGVVINTHLAEAEADLDVGSRVVLEVEGQREEWTVVGISTTTLVGPVAYLPADDLAEVLDLTGRADVLAVRLVEGADQAAAADALGALALDAGLPVGEVTTNDEIRADLDSIFAVVIALLLLVGAVLAVVAVVGVAGTMTLGVVEQTREIGVLRTLGASTWAVRRLLLLQGLAIATLGGVLGVVLSIPVSLLLGGAIGSTLISADFPFSFSWFGVGIWIAVAAAIGALGATQPSRVASRLSVRDTLAYE